MTTQDKILSLTQFIDRATSAPRLKVTFHAHRFSSDIAANPRAPAVLADGMVISLMVDQAQFRPFFQKIVDEQGLGVETTDGILVWLPWPFAAVTVAGIQ